MSEVRIDALSGESVIVAPTRSERPHAHRTDEPMTRGCPFCPGHEDETPPAVLELPLKGSSLPWFVRVFANLYPIVSSPSQGRISERSAGARPAGGVHEVIVETPFHEQEIAQRTPEELKLTLLAYRERLSSLSATAGIRYVTLFRNQGAGAGASLAHPHSQAVALSYLPKDVARTVQRWRRHHSRTGRCLLCDELEHERRAQSRIVLEQDGFVLYVPRGAVMAGEMVLAPSRHEACFVGAGEETLSRMSVILLDALGRLNTAFDEPAFNLVLQSWPRARRADEALHWYLRMIPRLAVLGGFELATGDFVSTLSPEEAAVRYRAAE